MKTDEKWHYARFTELLVYCDNLIKLLFLEGLSPDKKAESAKEIETAADSIMENIVERLRSAKRLPFEKQLVFNLAHNIDNIIDELEKAANRMKSYRVPLGEPGKKMLSLLTEAVEEAKLAVSYFGLGKKNFDQLGEHCVRIKKLESEADTVYRSTIAEISDQKNKAIDMLRASDDHQEPKAAIATLFQKIEYLNRSQEIIGILESAFDQAQDVANLIETLRYEIE